MIKTRPSVSVIVPAYNEESFLGRTLQSLRNQSYPNYELIVVDNNSTDGTNAIARRFADHVFVETRKGYAHAVMRGVAESHGELLTFCDADTLYPFGWLRRAVRVLERNPAASAVYGTCSTHDAGPVMNRINGLVYTQLLRASRLLGLENTSGFNFLMRRAAFEAVGGYDPRFTQMSPDVELGRRLTRVGPVVFRTSLTVQASFRRFQHGGVIKTLWMYLKVWYRMARGRAPGISYKQYNSQGR
jgi:glycosyltransferase involved in cell wall biosynthesis